MPATLSHASAAAHQGDVTALAASPDGTLLASGADDGTVAVWSWELSQQFAFDHDSPLVALAFSPAGSADGGADGGRPVLASVSRADLAVWSPPSATLRKTRLPPADAATAAAWSAEGGVLAVGLASGGVSLRDGVTGDEVGVLAGRVTQLASRDADDGSSDGVDGGDLAAGAAAVADLTWVPRLPQDGGGGGQADVSLGGTGRSDGTSCLADSFKPALASAAAAGGGGRSWGDGPDAASRPQHGQRENEPLQPLCAAESLAVAYADGGLAFFSGVDGRQLAPARHLGDGTAPVCLRRVALGGGEYLLVGLATTSTTPTGASAGDAGTAAALAGRGSPAAAHGGAGKRTVALLCTQDGVRLTGVTTTATPLSLQQQVRTSWMLAPRPAAAVGKGGADVAVVGSDGSLAVYSLSLSTVHGLYRHLYAYRDNAGGMTDVVVQHLLTGRRARIRCRDHVRKIAVYGRHLAVQLPDRMLVYGRLTAAGGTTAGGGDGGSGAGSVASPARVNPVCSHSRYDSFSRGDARAGVVAVTAGATGVLVPPEGLDDSGTGGDDDGEDGSDGGLHYVIRDRILGGGGGGGSGSGRPTLPSLECNLLVVTSGHVTLCADRRLTAFALKAMTAPSGGSGGTLPPPPPSPSSFTALMPQREWVLEAPIRYIKVTGGAPGREGLLVGLKGGGVYDVRLDDPVPRLLARHPLSIRCLDVSLSRRKLAVVDEASALTVYALPPPQLAAFAALEPAAAATAVAAANGSAPSQLPPSSSLASPAVLFSAPGAANSVSWNASCEDMLAYSGGGQLTIVTGGFPPHAQRLPGFVVGFVSSRVFCLHATAMQTVTVPLSDAMRRYVAARDWPAAYRIACLGVTHADWALLGSAALRCLPMQLATARAAYSRLGDGRALELVASLEAQAAASAAGPGAAPYASPASQALAMQGDVLAHGGDLLGAARLYVRAGMPGRAVRLFTDVRMWDEAAAVVEAIGDPAAVADTAASVTTAMLRAAQAAADDGDAREAAVLFTRAGQPEVGIRLLVDDGDAASLAELVASLPAPDLPGGSMTFSAVEPSLAVALVQAAAFFDSRGSAGDARAAWLRTGAAGAAPLLASLLATADWQPAEALAQRIDSEARGRGEVVLLALDPLSPPTPAAAPVAGLTAAAVAPLASVWSRVRGRRLLWLAAQAAAAVAEGRFTDAGTAYAQCGVCAVTVITAQAAGGASSSALTGSETAALASVALRCRRLGAVYAAYSAVVSPHNAATGGAIAAVDTARRGYHAARYLLKALLLLPAPTALSGQHYCEDDGTGPSATVPTPPPPPMPPGVAVAPILLTLARTSAVLGCFKSLRYAQAALQRVRLPPSVRDELDVLAMATAARPFTDAADAEEVCYRCGTVNAAAAVSIATVRAAAAGAHAALAAAALPPPAVLADVGVPLGLVGALEQAVPAALSPPDADGDSCCACGHTIVRSMATFEPLPLVEFAADPAVPPAEALALLQRAPPATSSSGSSSEAAATAAASGGTFLRALADANAHGVSGATPVTLPRPALAALRPSEAFVLRSRHLPAPPQQLPGPRLFKSVLPEVPLTLCRACYRLGHKADVDAALAAGRGCPSCADAML
jgi:hypothetical protein